MSVASIAMPEGFAVHLDLLLQCGHAQSLCWALSWCWALFGSLVLQLGSLALHAVLSVRWCREDLQRHRIANSSLLLSLSATVLVTIATATLTGFAAAQMSALDVPLANLANLVNAVNAVDYSFITGHTVVLTVVNAISQLGAVFTVSFGIGTLLRLLSRGGLGWGDVKLAAVLVAQLQAVAGQGAISWFLPLLAGSGALWLGQLSCQQRRLEWQSRQHRQQLEPRQGLGQPRQGLGQPRQAQPDLPRRTRSQRFSRAKSQQQTQRLQQWAYAPALVIAFWGSFVALLCSVSELGVKILG